MKRLTYITFLIGLLAVNAQAQTVNQDSIIRIAQKDAKSFVLNDKDLKRFRHDLGRNLPNPLKGPPAPPPLPGPQSANPRNRVKIDFAADFFKPNKTTTKDTTLLADSVYVKAFRAAAYKKTAHRRTAGHYIGLGGAIVAGVVLITIFLVAVTVDNS